MISEHTNQYGIESENELKVALDEVTYNKLLFTLGNYAPHVVPKTITQVNYYYDTRQFRLYRNGITLRVRQKDSGLRVEVKFAKHSDGVLHTCKELSVPTEALPRSIALKDMAAHLHVPLTTRAYLIGVLSTKRTLICMDPGLTVQLDMSCYLGVTDYELEIEHSAERKEEALALCKRLVDHPLPERHEGKYTRFVNELKRIRTANHILDI